MNTFTKVKVWYCEYYRMQDTKWFIFCHLIDDVGWLLSCDLYPSLPFSLPAAHLYSKWLSSIPPQHLIWHVLPFVLFLSAHFDELFQPSLLLSCSSTIPMFFFLPLFSFAFLPIIWTELFILITLFYFNKFWILSYSSRILLAV